MMGKLAKWIGSWEGNNVCENIVMISGAAGFVNLVRFLLNESGSTGKCYRYAQSAVIWCIFRFFMLLGPWFRGCKF